MIKKYIKNTEEIRQRLIEMLMEDAREMCRYQRDIYMYIDDNGRASLEWFVNVGGNSWLDDDHILLHRCREHHESIEDSIDGTEMLADIISMTEDELIYAVCSSEVIDPDDLDLHDCYEWAMVCYGSIITSWYETCILDAASNYADEADEIMRAFCRKSIDDAGRIEDITDTVPIVWLFVIDALDQRALDKQRGGAGND